MAPAVPAASQPLHLVRAPFQPIYQSSRSSSAAGALQAKIRRKLRQLAPSYVTEVLSGPTSHSQAPRLCPAQLPFKFKFKFPRCPASPPPLLPPPNRLHFGTPLAQLRRCPQSAAAVALRDAGATGCLLGALLGRVGHRPGSPGFGPVCTFRRGGAAPDGR